MLANAKCLAEKLKLERRLHMLWYALEVLNCSAKETWMTNKTKRSEEAGPPGEDTPAPGTEIANPQSKRPV